MKANRWLTVAGYLLALYLVLVPLFETTIAIWPFGIGDRQWRFGAVGLYTGAMMTPLLGLLIALVIALYVRNRGMIRAIVVVGGAAAAVTLLSIPVFLMDAVQLRGDVDANAVTAVNVATGSAVFKMILAIVICGAVAWGGWISRLADPLGRSTPREGGHRVDV